MELGSSGIAPDESSTSCWWEEDGKRGAGRVSTLGEGNLSSPRDTSQFPRHDRIGLRSDAELDQVVVGFVGQVGTPSIEHRLERHRQRCAPPPSHAIRASLGLSQGQYVRSGSTARRCRFRPSIAANCSTREDRSKRVDLAHDEVGNGTAATPAAASAAWDDMRAQLHAFDTPAGWEGPNDLLITAGRRP